MRSIIHTTSVIGCSISLLFSLLASLVLSCCREKTRLLLIKQQQSISLVFINIVMLSGFQGVQSKGLCQAATTLLQYFVLACFSWLAADQYLIFKSVVQMKPHVNFMKMFVAAWGFPLLSLILQLLIGYLVDGNKGSAVYNCWGSDFVALTLLIPASGLSLASIALLSLTVKRVIRLPVPTTYTKKKKDYAIRYGIKTSCVMMFITVNIWIFAHLLFWYPDYINIQLVFGLSSGFQGLFHFFFYCVFALELDIYVSDNRFCEADDVDEFPKNTNSVKLSSTNRRDIKNIESLRGSQKETGTGQFVKESHDLSSTTKEAPSSFQQHKTTPTISRRLSDPLPSSASGRESQVLFEAKMPMATARLKRAKSKFRKVGTEEDEAFSSLSGDKPTSPLPLLKSVQSTARLDRAKQNASLVNSLLLPGEIFLSSRTEKQTMESKRSSVLNCGPVPAYSTCAIASHIPMYPLGNELCTRCERNEQLPNHYVRRGSDSSFALLVAAKSSTLLKPLRLGPFANDAPGASVSKLRRNTEPEFTKRDKELPVLAMMQIQPYCEATEVDRREYTENSKQQQLDSPQVDVNSCVRRTIEQRQSSHELEKTFSCMSADDKSRSCLSPKMRMRARKSVPSLKFTLNEDSMA